MTHAQVIVLVVYATIIAIWPIRWIVLEFILRRQVFLTPASPRYAEPEPPLVTAIVPAKDEEANIEQCLRSVAALMYPRLEILIVNDRSTDCTEEIARGLAASDPRMRVVSIDHLPPGWTGKTHALDRGAALANGRWLLFLDADTSHSPDSLSIMMEFARKERAALVTLLPELRCETFWEQVVQPVAGITLMQSFPLHNVNDDRSPLAFANGQYILIERPAYDAVDGHRSVRDRFVEDIALGRLVKARGMPIRVVLVKELVTCRMYASLGQLVKGWSRILYDSLDQSPWRLLGKLLDPIVFCQSGHVALAVALGRVALGWGGPFTTWLLALSVLHHALMFAVFRRVYAVGVPRPSFAAWFPVANLVVDVILARAISMCLTGKVSWRGTVYGDLP
jgi:chlorobactene glucosyltransferase